MTDVVNRANSLLHFDESWSVDLLENLVSVVYSTHGEEQSKAQILLSTIKEHPDAWTKVDSILEKSKSQQTKYFALQVLEDAIKKRWKALPREQCEAIKKYITGLIISCSADYQTMQMQKLYLQKLNNVLVQILKYEWPNHWPTFIADLVGSSLTGESICQNNLEILKLLSEEVFDFSGNSLTQAKANVLKKTMCSEFSQIFELCQNILSNSGSLNLINTTLETLLIFITWIPHGYLLETDLAEALISKYLGIPELRNVTIKCLTEIVSIKVTDANENIVNEKLLGIFVLSMRQLAEMIPLNVNIREAYNQSQEKEQNFIMNFALYLSAFLRNYGKLLERNTDIRQFLEQALTYMVLISEVEELEIFKVCVEYWTALTLDLHNEVVGTSISPHFREHRELNSHFASRIAVYKDTLQKVRLILIDRMARPEEVIVVENEHGEVVREFYKDTDAIILYKNMKECLIYLTALDPKETENVLTAKLQKQLLNGEQPLHQLNTLCWAIGSISGTLHEEDEKRFLVYVIKELLGLCEQRKGKDNKAIIASNIMYVVGQYPRFLRAHWKFLKTVVNKLFEFMHETHEGVQDMACDTFIKIVVQCKRHFISVQPSELMPFIDEIAASISTITCDLNTQQVCTFFEAVGEMISAQTDLTLKAEMLDKCMFLPNQSWEGIVMEITKDIRVLDNLPVIKHCISILKINYHVCKPVGSFFAHQLFKIFPQLLHVYKIISENLSIAGGRDGEAVFNSPIGKHLKAVKKETLNLIHEWISCCNERCQISDDFLVPLFSAILLDYKTNCPAAREAEVLSCVSICFDKLNDLMAKYVSEIFEAVFECTLEMISKNFEDYPEHRKAFYYLLKSVVTNCFKALLELSAPQFKFVYDSIIWGMKHTDREIVDLGFSTLFQLICNFQTLGDTKAASIFYQQYFLETLEHVLEIISGSSLTTGITQHSHILATMFTIVENGQITVPLNASLKSASQNLDYVKDYAINLFRRAFTHLRDEQIRFIVEGFVHYDQNIERFQEHLRDFLIELREFSGTDTSDLYLEDREKELRKAADEKRNQMRLCTPAQIALNEADNMED